MSGLEDALPLLSGGGVLSVLVGLAIVLIKQVSAGGQITEQQTAGWERLVSNAQTDAAIARAATASLAEEMERREQEYAADIASLRAERDTIRARVAHLERELDGIQYRLTRRDDGT